MFWSVIIQVLPHSLKCHTSYILRIWYPRLSAFCSSTVLQVPVNARSFSVCVQTHVRSNNGCCSCSWTHSRHNGNTSLLLVMTGNTKWKSPAGARTFTLATPCQFWMFWSAGLNTNSGCPTGYGFYTLTEGYKLMTSGYKMRSPSSTLW